MVPTTAEYLDDLVTLISRILRQAMVVRRDANPDRAVLDMVARHGSYEIRISEIMDTSGRKYAYYVLQEGQIVVGFDNTPDVQALRLRFGPEAKQHWGERIPHRHLANKSKIELTDEMTCRAFLVWLQTTLPPSDSSTIG